MRSGGLIGKITGRLGGEGSLARRMLSASAWTAGSSVAIAFLRLASNLVTTRLLLPEAFGLMSIVLAIEAACTLILNIGFRQSVQREPDGDTQTFLRTAWTMQLCAVSVISLMILTVAGVISLVADDFAPEGSVFAEPVLPALLAAAALIPLIRGTFTAAEMVAMRNLNYRTIAFLDLCATVLGVTSTLIAVWLFPTVWSLLFGVLISMTIRSTLSSILFPKPTMWFEMNRDVAGRIWAYGRFIMGTTPLNFISRQGDRFLFGAFMDTTTFGIYAIARVWSEATRQLCNKIITAVGFSGLAEIHRTDPEGLPHKFTKFQRAADLMYVTCFLGLLIVGPVVIDLLYLEIYAQAGLFLMVLSLLFLTNRMGTLGSLLLAVGDSRSPMRFAAIRAAALLTFVPLGFNLGGTAGGFLGLVLASGAAIPYQLWVVRSRLPGHFIREQIFASLAILAVTAAVFFWVGNL